MISAPEAERAVLGSMLIEREAIASCVDLIQPEHFNEAQNVAVVRCIYDLFKANRPLDIVAVIEAGKASGLEFPSLGAYLGQCIESVTSAAHAGHHARTVLDRSYKRKIIDAAGRLAGSAMAEDGVNERLAEIQKLVLEADAIFTSKLDSYNSGFDTFLEDVGAQSKREVYRTGIRQLDILWKGIASSEICTIAAGPGVGKSTLALNLLHNFGAQNIPCAYFGTEMKSLETKMRHVSIASGVPSFKFRIGALSLEDRRLAYEAISGTIGKMPISISNEDRPSIAKIDAVIAEGKFKVVMIDSLMFCDLPKAENMRLRVQQFMVDLNALKHRRNVAIFLIVHLGRQAYGNTEAKPSLADLMESNSLERVSDKILLLWKPQAKQLPNGDRVIEVINAKDRQNPDGQCFDLIVDRRTMKITERTDEAIPHQLPL